PHLLQASCCLFYPLRLPSNGEANIALTVLPKPYSGGGHDSRPLQQLGGIIDGASSHPGPEVERSPGLLQFQADILECLVQDLYALLVDLAVLIHHLSWAVHSHEPCIRHCASAPTCDVALDLPYTSQDIGSSRHRS